MSVTFNPHDAEFMKDPHRWYAQLRDDAFVQREGSGDWFVTDYQHVLSLLHDERLGYESSEAAIEDDFDVPSRAERTRGLLAIADRVERLELPYRKASENIRLRQIVTPLLQSAISASEMRLQAILEGILEPLGTLGEFDVVSQIAGPFAVRAIFDLLGIPVRDVAHLGALLDARADALDVDASASARAAGRLAYVSLMDYCLPHVRTPRPDTLLAELGRRLEIMELLANVLIMLLAATVTTRGLISQTVACALEDGDLWRSISRDTTRVPSLIEEALRHASMLHAITKRALVDIPLDDGRCITRGAMVHLVLGAANRDPAVFSNPDAVEADRCPNRHLAFGHGRHLCIGAELARMEARLVLVALARRHPNLRVVESRMRLTNYRFRVLECLRVGCNPRGSA